ncbi:MAG TPA: MFS transporter [Bryobacteraceae bacterium]
MINRVFRALSYRDFRLMWLGACTSQIGTFVQQFAQSWLVFDMTKDPFYLGLDLFLGQVPIILFSLVGGVLADRIDRRKLLLGSQYIQMTCAFLLAGLFYFHRVHIWQILGLSFFVGCGQSMGGPAYSALLPSLVDPEDLSNAIAMNAIQFNLARIVGPTIGGLAYTALGATWCFALNGVSYIAVIISLLMIQVKFIPAKSSVRIWTSMKEGFRFIRQREGLEPLVLLAFLMTLLGFTLVGFLPVFVQEVFKQGPKTYQLLLICSGGGAVTGGLIVAALGRMKHQGRTVLLLMTGLGVLISSFALSHWLPLSCVLLFGSGMATMGSASLMLSTVQLMVADEMRGRVMSVYNVAFRGGIPMGGLVLGRLIPVFGLSPTVAVAGSALAAIALYFLLVQRRITAL